mmetsp:Transcript_17206/g.43155  ORF Transcript_17206/g.43155 Transcript_17206/m.43155 type:complete len:201 (-) Transcript_17206:1526-2128(-)
MNVTLTLPPRIKHALRCTPSRGVVDVDKCNCKRAWNCDSRIPARLISTHTQFNIVTHLCQALLPAPMQQHMRAAPAGLLASHRTRHLLAQCVMQRQVLAYTSLHTVAEWQHVLCPHWIQSTRHPTRASQHLLTQTSHAVAMSAYVQPSPSCIMQHGALPACRDGQLGASSSAHQAGRPLLCTTTYTIHTRHLTQSHSHIV